MHVETNLQMTSDMLFGQTKNIHHLKNPLWLGL